MVRKYQRCVAKLILTERKIFTTCSVKISLKTHTLTSKKSGRTISLTLMLEQITITLKSTLSQMLMKVGSLG